MVKVSKVLGFLGNVIFVLVLLSLPVGFLTTSIIKKQELGCSMLTHENVASGKKECSGWDWMFGFGVFFASPWVLGVLFFIIHFMMLGRFPT